MNVLRTAAFMRDTIECEMEDKDKSTNNLGKGERMSEKMTREQAITELSLLLNEYQDTVTGDAIDMGITALEARVADCDTCKFKDRSWDEEPCDSCCENHNGYSAVSALDKIRAEIVACLKALDAIEKSRLNIYLPNEMSGRRLTYQQCLGFIDKYKAEIEPQESEDKESCDNCKHNAESWDSDACDGCCESNNKWSGEIYPGEFEAMEHNGRMDALESEEWMAEINKNLYDSCINDSCIFQT